MVAARAARAGPPLPRPREQGDFDVVSNESQNPFADRGNEAFPGPGTISITPNEAVMKVQVAMEAPLPRDSTRDESRSSLHVSLRVLGGSFAKVPVPLRCLPSPSSMCVCLLACVRRLVSQPLHDECGTAKPSVC